MSMLVKLTTITCVLPEMVPVTGEKYSKQTDKDSDDKNNTYEYHII